MAKGEAYGIAAITRAFQGADFPSDKQALLQTIAGKEKVHWTKEHTIDLREILESIQEDRITGITQLTHLINDKMHQKAEG